MAHSYSNIYKIPITMLRFFSAYGPWGRPDMALFKFTKLILEKKQIDIYNFGNMERDFTYIDDLVSGVYKISKKIPNKSQKNKVNNDTLSEFAPFRIVNIGSSSPIKILDFVKVLEDTIGIKAKKRLIKHQVGDVKSTWASSSLIKSLVNYSPTTNVNDGVRRFLDWYLEYFSKK